jgi:serine protease Do
MIPAFGELGERLRRSTVQVEVGPAGSGSGVIWDAQGLVVTNAHVAQGPRARVTLWDNRQYPAQVESRDVARDLATLRFRAPDLTPAPIGDSGKLSPGEIVIAVGNPLGFIGALTKGVVHAVGPVAGLSRRPYVQADVRLAPGNSGGPLADAQGRVIGINSMVVRGGLGLAIPSNVVRDFLAKPGERPALGIAIRSVTVRFRSKMAPGLLVLDVTRGGAADRASLMVGDVLIAVDGKGFETFDELSVALESAAGRPLTLRFLRGDRTAIRETTVDLALPVEAHAA